MSPSYNGPSVYESRVEQAEQDDATASDFRNVEHDLDRCLERFGRRYRPALSGEGMKR